MPSKEFVKNYITSVIRTVVPLIVGAVASWFATKGITLDEQILLHMRIGLELLFTTAYYGIVRLLEHWHPNFGWLLGVAKRPIYMPNKVEPMV